MGGVASRRATAARSERASERARATAYNRAHARGTDVNPELHAYATARLDPHYGSVIVEDDPYAPDARFEDGWNDGPPAECPMRSSHRVPRACTLPNGHEWACQWSPASRRTARKAPPAAPVMSPAIVAHDGGKLPPCPRCGRTDWRQNGVGRQWHLDNYPACGKSPQHPAHEYATGG